MNIVSVAIPVPLQKTFDYTSNDIITIGSRIKVSFNNRLCVGIVIANPKQSAYLIKLKPVIEVLDTVPIITSSMLELLQWAAKYYHHSIGEVIFSALPKNIKLGKKITLKKNSIIQKQIVSTIAPNNAQQKVINTILSSNGYNAFLLHGITGSGKTEVYIRISEVVLQQGKQVLILVPEIGLTPQMIQRFASRLNTVLVVIHSQLSESEKLDAYILAKENKAGVILGTRSAIFSPASNLGLIIIDEEHDSSFKQQSGFRYCAKDLAFIRTKKKNIPLILGSATPSLETLYNVINKKIKHLVLKHRAGDAKLPVVNIIDMASQNNKILSEKLINSITQHLNNNKQVMLFLNRRGYAPVYHCQNCNWQAKCDNCSANMVLHNTSYRLRCHHCGLEILPHDKCPSCKDTKLTVVGYGTQRLEEMLYAYFPNIDIIRIDRDTTRKKQAMQKYIKQISSNKPCIILGTQMLAKGHNFTNLAMVGILDTDASFFSIDFRSTEHLAQLIMQVAGRAGRDKDAGEVYIQSNQPSNRLFYFIKQHNYIDLAKLLLQERKLSKTPPYAYQALISANSKNQDYAREFLLRLKQNLNINNVAIWGPANAIIEKKATYYYVNLYLSSTSRKQLHLILDKLDECIEKFKNPKKVRWFLDIDPI